MRRLLDLRDLEARLRIEGRLYELYPNQQQEARRRFRRATAARRLRLALLRRWQLI